MYGMYRQMHKMLLIKLIYCYNCRRVCTICEFGSKRQFYSLRGLCPDSRHDRIYTWERTADKKPFLKGLSFSTITWVCNSRTNINIIVPDQIF